MQNTLFQPGSTSAATQAAAAPAAKASLPAMQMQAAAPIKVEVDGAGNTVGLVETTSSLPSAEDATSSSAASGSWPQVPAPAIDLLSPTTQSDLLDTEETEHSSEVLLGQGGFSKVYLKELADGRLGAVKVGLDEAAAEMILAEGELLRSWSHKNILKVIDWLPGAVPVFEHCDGGDLMLQDNFSRAIFMNWALDIALALSYVHERKVIHRDVKPNNIFIKTLASKNGSVAILGDVGVCLQLPDEEDTTRRVAGTLEYFSMEVVRGKPFGTPADMWSWGVTFFEKASQVLQQSVGEDALVCLVRVLKFKAADRSTAEETVEDLKTLVEHEDSLEVMDPVEYREVEMDLQAMIEKVRSKARERVRQSDEAELRGKEEEKKEREAEKEERDEEKEDSKEEKEEASTSKQEVTEAERAKADRRAQKLAHRAAQGRMLAAKRRNRKHV